MKSPELPASWKWRRLAELIAKFDAGVSVNGGDRPAMDGEYGVLKISAVTEGSFRPSENKVIEGLEQARASLNPKRDRLIISRANTPDLIGANAYIDRDYPNLFLSDKLWQLEPRKDNELSMRWLGCVLGSATYRKKMSKIATGSSQSMKNISQESVMQLELPVPDFTEQQHIAQLLEHWDTAIEKTERLIAAKENYLKAIEHQLLSARKRLNGFSNNWESLRADNIFESASLKGFGSEPLLSVTQDRGVIPRDRLTGRVTMPSGETTSFKLVDPGNFVISLRSFQGGLEHSAYRGLVSPAYTVLRATREIDVRFFRHYFRSADFIKRLSVAVIGIRDGKQVSFQDFCSIKIPFPPIEEQQAIAAMLDEAEREIVLLRNQVTAFKKQKRGLMQKLLTGQWRVKLPETEAA